MINIELRRARASGLSLSESAVGDQDLHQPGNQIWFQERSPINPGAQTDLSNLQTNVET
jgi:hypothetical protein